MVLQSDADRHDRLEEKRKVRSEAYYLRKKALVSKLNAAKREVTTNSKELAKFGY
jgi:large subunit ribosomal protein L13Ae